MRGIPFVEFSKALSHIKEKSYIHANAQEMKRKERSSAEIAIRSEIDIPASENSRDSALFLLGDSRPACSGLPKALNIDHFCCLTYTLVELNLIFIFK